MTLAEVLDALGIKLSVLVAGAAGGVLRALSRRPHNWRETIVSPICGALAAAYLSGAIVHYLRLTSFPLPEDPAAAIGAVGFILGVSAMWISDIVLAVLARRLKQPQA